MITLFNPTNETFKMMYGGIGILMEPSPAPSHKMNVEDPTGGHLLNAFSARGLCQLIFGDDEKAVGDEGRERNLEFKKAQVIRYNTLNEQRKMSGMGYLPPTDTVKQYAFELGIQLLQPYSLKDAEVSAIHNVVKENVELKGILVVQNEKIEKLENLVQNLVLSLGEGKKESLKTSSAYAGYDPESKKSPRERIFEEEPGKKGKGT
ncbi:MAG: hypothetical protein ABIJ57_15645 [Pseudomonadota bacterium]